MKKRMLIGLTVVCLALMMAVPAWCGQGAFFTMLDDIPLMSGLIELQDDSSLFDTPEGRVADLSARIVRADAQAVRAFYARTLPQMGWTATGGDSFSRDGEHLSLRIENGTLHLTLSPEKPRTLRN